MRATSAVIAGLLSLSSVAAADPASQTVRYDKLVVMTPTPTQSAGPSLRLRTMVRPADHLWVGPAIPSFVTPAIGHQDLDLLDQRSTGGWVATYRQTFDDCGWTPDNAKNCTTLVKLFDATGKELWSVQLDSLLSRKTQLEVQDVRYAEDTGTLYFNEACQSYSKEAGGRCSSLVAYDPLQKKVLWRTPSLTSNNEFVLVGKYIITGYGFTAEKSSVRIVRRSDGAILDTKPLAGPNFEMTRAGIHLKVDLPTDFGDANFDLTDLDGAAPKLVARPNTRSTYVPKPYDPPLVPDPSRTNLPLPF
jgi:hypothetical protein